MDTVTLSNGLKALFGTSQSTATNIPTCAADGTPAGNISVANLASVLGVETSDTVTAGGSKTYNIGLYIIGHNQRGFALLQYTTTKGVEYLAKLSTFTSDGITITASNDSFTIALASNTVNLGVKRLY